MMLLILLLPEDQPDSEVICGHDDVRHAPMSSQRK